MTEPKCLFCKDTGIQGTSFVGHDPCEHCLMLPELPDLAACPNPACTSSKVEYRTNTKGAEYIMCMGCGLSVTEGGRDHLYATWNGLRSGSSAVTDIAAERTRQIAAEGWTHQHDDEHGDGSLAAAGAAYAFNAAISGRFFAVDPLGFWPWGADSWKPRSPREDLVRAAALIVAEIERLDRAAQQEDAHG